MQAYQVRFGYSEDQGISREKWIVRGRNFAEAANKAVKIAARRAKDYERREGLEVVSMELLGKEEE